MVYLRVIKEYEHKVLSSCRALSSESTVYDAIWVVEHHFWNMPRYIIQFRVCEVIDRGIRVWSENEFGFLSESSVWVISIIQQHESPVWVNSMGQQYKSTVWIINMNHQYESSVWVVSMNHQYESSVWIVNIVICPWHRRCIVNMSSAMVICWSIYVKRKVTVLFVVWCPKQTVRLDRKMSYG